MRKLDKKIAIVTSAGQGIGRGIALKLAAEGASVVVTDLNETTARQTAADIGSRAIAMQADVTSKESVQVMTAHVHEQFGRIDILVNNAGLDKVGPFLGSDERDWQRIIAINVFGALNTSKAVVSVMADQGSGHMINIASDARRVGSSGEAIYSAAKGSVIALTKALAREMARHQITVNCVCARGPPIRHCLPRSAPKIPSCAMR